MGICRAKTSFRDAVELAGQLLASNRNAEHTGGCLSEIQLGDSQNE